MAAVLGITQQPGKSVSESVASVLEGRSRLLVLVFDNCEHVVDSVADLVDAILAASATVKVLATSREGIGVADEQLRRVPSLNAGAAVELFVERAQSMVSDPLADEATAVEEDVCRRLDGIPLAIELAASRMASMTAAEVRDRLNDRFKLLVGSRRGLERHQTLRQPWRGLMTFSMAPKVFVGTVFGVLWRIRRLNDRFKLLVGSRRGLERHQTLRQPWRGLMTFSMAPKVFVGTVFGVLWRIRPQERLRGSRIR